MILVRRIVVCLTTTVLVALSLIIPAASAGATGGISVLLVDEFQRPIANATVTAVSPSGTFTVISDAQGHADFLALPPDTYIFRASKSGYASAVQPGVTIRADDSHSLALIVHHASSAIPPAATAGPRASGIPTATGPKIVHDSVLAMYDASHPEHMNGEPYYGRYSYVLLRDGDAAAKAKNQAFITKLIDLFAPTGSTISKGPGNLENPWSYNIFFFPVRNAAAIKVTANHDTAAAAIMTSYNYGTARTVRDAYCAVKAHASWSPCKVPLDAGPLVLTFLQPLPRDVLTSTMPPAFAYDFTLVSINQCDVPLNTVQQKIEVPGPILADTLLPPPKVAIVANILDSISTVLTMSVNIVVSIDKGFKTAHGQ
jgi:hypothetical protein